MVAPPTKSPKIKTPNQPPPPPPSPPPPPPLPEYIMPGIPPPMPPPIGGIAGIFLDVGDACLCGEEHCGRGSCVLQSGSGNLSRVNDACADHVDVVFGSCVEANAFLAALDLSYYDTAFITCVLSNLTNRFLEGSDDDLSACLGVAFQTVNVFCYCRDRIDESYAAACYDTFLNSCLGSVESVFDSEFSSL